jgi:hypothetical protein
MQAGDQIKWHNKRVQRTPAAPMTRNVNQKDLRSVRRRGVSARLGTADGDPGGAGTKADSGVGR